jgi:type IV pilus assembly protein PilN
MIKINLLAEAKRPAAVRRAKVPAGRKARAGELGQWLLLGTLLLFLAACGAYWLMLISQSNVKARQIAEAELEKKRLAPIIQDVKKFEAKKAELEHKIEVIKGLQANQQGPMRVMDSISRALPELLWLNRLEMSSNSVKLTGRAFNTNAVASFIENLDRVPEFHEPELFDTKREGEVYSFSLQFGYRPPIPAAQPATDGERVPAEQPAAPPAAGSARGG